MNTCCRAMRALAAACALSATAMASPAAADEYMSYTGTATALRSNEFLYGEQHLLVEHDGKLAQRVVLYTCRNGSPFARKSVSYVDPLAPNFVLEDASDGMREGIRAEGAGRTVFFRAAYEDAEKSAALPRVAGLVADAGFDAYVRANWQPLTADKALRINFLIPSRLDDMGFRVEELRSDRLAGVPVDVFRLKLAGFFGWFLPGIDVYYGVQDHILMRYVGLSDLRGASGDNYKVDISFDPKDRKPAGQDALDRALQARLAPCM
jgi:hypothetical protein